MFNVITMIMCGPPKYDCSSHSLMKERAAQGAVTMIIERGKATAPSVSSHQSADTPLAIVDVPSV